jgi:adenine C2-methylase RlmN of 23S rRNA A2503 and tRNA A37
MPTRYAASAEEIAELLSDWGEPKYRLRQIWDGLYRRRAPLEELTDLGVPLRATLAEALPLALAPLHTSTSGDRETL